MQHCGLTGLTSEPRSGVVTDHRSVYLVMEKKEMGDIKESIMRKLNSNINKYYPDARGIMMGYQGIKLKRNTSEVTTVNPSLLHAVYIRAKFYLFKPQVGSELQCVVHKRVDKLVTCLAHGVFEVEVVSPPQAWENVFVGQVVVVKVNAIEQLAGQEPKIVASLLEVSDDIGAQFFDVVDSFDEDEVKTITDSGMFEYENNQIVNDWSRSQVTMSSNTKGDVLRMSFTASSDESDNEENRLVVPRIPPSSESDSSDDEHKMLLSKTPTRPSENAAINPKEFSDSSKTDCSSSKESPKTKTAPTLYGDNDAKKLGDSAAQIKNNSDSAMKQSSSSSSSDSEEVSQKIMPKMKKITKTKNSPKSDIQVTSKANKSLMDGKSPHLSSTVVSGVERSEDKISVPDGISPTLWPS